MAPPPPDLFLFHLWDMLLSLHKGTGPQERSGGATSPAWWSLCPAGEVDVPSPRRVLTYSKHRGDPAGYLGPPHTPSCPPGSC
ncbi:hypothetical protein Nmel_011276 [Mimus melanotis]